MSIHYFRGAIYRAPKIMDCYRDMINRVSTLKNFIIRNPTFYKNFIIYNPPSDLSSGLPGNSYEESQQTT